jgi:hypothetical protein
MKTLFTHYTHICEQQKYSGMLHTLYESRLYGRMNLIQYEPRRSDKPGGLQIIVHAIRSSPFGPDTPRPLDGPFMPRNPMPGHGSPVLLLKFRLPPDIDSQHTVSSGKRSPNMHV